MKLSDVMSAMQLAAYAEIGLVLFMLAFTLVIFDLVRGRKRDLEPVRLLPLEEAPRAKTENRP